MLTSLSHAQTSSKAYFTKGTAELAKNAAARDKNVALSSFVNAINSMTSITAEQWTADDYIRVMQSYQYAVEYSTLNAESALDQMKSPAKNHDPILKRTADNFYYVLDQTLSSATKFYYSSASNKPDAADFHLSAALTFLLPLVMSTNNEPGSQQKNSLAKALEFATHGAVDIIDHAISSLLKQPKIYNNQFRSLAKCHDYLAEIFEHGDRNQFCFQTNMLGVKAINNIPVQEKSAEDLDLFSRLFIRLAGVIPEDKSRPVKVYYSELIETMCALFRGGNDASFAKLYNTFNKVWDLIPYDPDLNEFTLQCLRVIDKTHQNTLLPPSELVTALRNPSKFNSFQQMKSGLERRTPSLPTPSTAGIFKQENSPVKASNTSVSGRVFHRT